MGEREEIVDFLRGRASLVRDAAAKVGRYSLPAEIVAATLEANAMMIEQGEHERGEPQSEPEGPLPLGDKMNRLAVRSMPESVGERLFRRGKVCWMGSEYNVKDVRVSELGRVIGLEPGVERKHGR